MKASLRSVRIAPKKANLVAKMIRGMSVRDARALLIRTHKKAAKLLDALVASAAANAQHNDKQSVDDLIIRSLVVNKAQAYHRGVPMARGRVRPMRKFLSHIELTLGIDGEVESAQKVEKKDKGASQEAKKTAQSKQSGGKKPAASKGTGASKKQTDPRSSASAAKKSASSSK